jgi:DNA-binding response OmpR family regulator
MAGSLATVLICEDEPALRELMRISVGDGFDFAEADDAASCLELARATRPDVILLDVMLPGRDGIDVLRELRRDRDLAHTRVLVVTAQPATRDDAMRAGADLVIEKPFDPDDIRTAVKEVISTKR